MIKRKLQVKKTVIRSLTKKEAQSAWAGYGFWSSTNNQNTDGCVQFHEGTYCAVESNTLPCK